MRYGEINNTRYYKPHAAIKLFDIIKMMKIALVVIDVQNYFVTERVKNLPKKIAEYIDKYRNRFDYVMFTKFVNNQNSYFFKYGWHECMSSPDTDIHSDLVNFAEKYRVFEKISYSIFKAKGFTEFLKQHKITKLLLCGLDTDACVLASAFDAFDLGYEINVLTDLCESHSTKELHTIALRIITKNIQLSR